MSIVTTKEAMEGLFKAAINSLFHIAPEKKEKLISEVFKEHNWQMTGEDGKANFSAVAEDREVILKYSGLASLWCTAYAAFHIMDLASKKQRLADCETLESIDISNECDALKLQEYIDYARCLFAADRRWPETLKRPDSNANPDSTDGKINNLFLGALSWIILHEIAHVHHGDTPLLPSSLRVQQEFKADAFATSWVLDEAGNGIQREFRVLMISVALVWLFLCESVRGQGSTHPPAIFRFREAVEHFNLLNRSVALENLAYVFKAIFDSATNPPELYDPKEFFVWVSKRMEELFPCCI